MGVIMHLRKMTLITAGLLVLAALLLAGCSREKAKPKPAVPPTQTMPAVITRIVTPGPTRTPVPPPTLAYDIVHVAGNWLLRFDLSITDGSFAQVLSYNGLVSLLVSQEGTITGTGRFSQSIDNPPCDASTPDTEGLGFTVRGTTYPLDNVIMVEIDLVPDNPEQNETYQLICPDFQDVRRYQQPLLWPGLMALQRRDLGGGAAVEGLHWTFPLKNTPNLHLESDLLKETNGLVTGYLTGDVGLARQ
jgi:hypothetical protein